MDMQAMDRCHRIGQTRPVHVYRLATAQSVECRMLKVATGKLKLEHLVIEKGQFKQEQDTMKTTLKVRRARISCACSDSLLEITSLYFGF
jgi:ATP-dependent DNA helicase